VKNCKPMWNFASREKEENLR